MELRCPQAHEDHLELTNRWHTQVRAKRFPQCSVVLCTESEGQQGQVRAKHSAGQEHVNQICCRGRAQRSPAKPWFLWRGHWAGNSQLAPDMGWI